MRQVLVFSILLGLALCCANCDSGPPGGTVATNTNASATPGAAVNSNMASNTSTTTTNTSTNGNELPQFPWPPPRASARYEVPPELLRNPDAAVTTLDDVSNKLKAALDAAGYAQRSWYDVPNGFALICQLEQFKSDGTPTGESNRWLDVVTTRQVLSIRDYLQSLFTAEPGHYRVIAFIVTDKSFTQAPKEPSKAEITNLVESGANRLPQEKGRIEFTTAYNCTAMVYEYERISNSRPTIFKRPGSLAGRVHLEKSGIMVALRR